MKNLSTIVIAMALVLLTPCSVFGAKIYLDDIPLNNAYTVEINGRTMVPVRDVAEMLGVQVEWVSGYDTIELFDPWHNRLFLSLAIGEPYAAVLGYGPFGDNVEMVSVNLDMPPEIIDGAAYVPLRFLAEVLGLGVEFSPQNDVKMYTVGYMPMGRIVSHGPEWPVAMEQLSEIIYMTVSEWHNLNYASKIRFIEDIKRVWHQFDEPSGNIPEVTLLEVVEISVAKAPLEAEVFRLICGYLNIDVEPYYADGSEWA